MELLSDITNKMKNKEERIKIIEYYNNSPDTDLIPDEVGIVELCHFHRNVPYCEKCLLVHDDNHKCYVYDRLFSSFIGASPHMLFSNEKLKQFEKWYYPDHKKGRYTLEWNDVSGSITSIWINDKEFQTVDCDFYCVCCETCNFIAQRYYDWE